MLHVSDLSGCGEPDSLAGRDLALLIGMNLIWGLNLIAAKIGVGQFPPIFFTALRFGSLGLFLIPMLRIHRGQMTYVLAAAMLTGPAAFALLFTGVYLVEDASTVAIASQMGVPFSTLMSVWLLGEVIRWPARRASRSPSRASSSSASTRTCSTTGKVWRSSASSFIGSLGLIFVKRGKVFVPLNYRPDRRSRRLGADAPQSDAGVRSMGVGAGRELGRVERALLHHGDVKPIAHTAWYYLVSHPVTSLSPITLLSPLFGVFFGVTLLDDHLTTRMLAGGAVTLIGVFIVVMREKRLVDTGT